MRERWAIPELCSSLFPACGTVGLNFSLSINSSLQLTFLFVPPVVVLSGCRHWKHHLAGMSVGQHLPLVLAACSLESSRGSFYKRWSCSSSDGACTVGAVESRALSAGLCTAEVWFITESDSLFRIQVVNIHPLQGWYCSLFSCCCIFRVIAKFFFIYVYLKNGMDYTTLNTRRCPGVWLFITPTYWVLS